MYHPSTDFFHPNIRHYISDTIQQHHGDEVFFIAWIDKEGSVSECEAISFGNDTAVPAPLAEGLKGDLVIHNHPSGDLRASNLDINIASLLATKKLGFYIINNNCSEVNIVYKPKSRVFLQENQVLSLFQKNGLLEELMGFYEERPEQETLTKKITQAINESKILMAEAGTGTGKSLAYLIPTVLWAVLSDKRVFITTHTINLQNQIAQKDAELVSLVVERLTGIRPRFAVLVGRANYFCPKAFHDLKNDSDKSYSLFDNHDSIAHQLELIQTWAEHTEEGLRSEIPEKIIPELWEELSASTPNCPRKECPFYADCFYYKARMTAESSHVLIGNHALLLAAIDDEQGFLSTIPHFSGIVLDEAHNLSIITLNSMAESFSFGSIMWRLSRLYRQKGDSFFGQLSFLRDRSTLDRYPELSDLFYKIGSTILTLAQNMKQREQHFRDLLQQHVEISTEITPQLFSKVPWSEAKKILTFLFEELKQIESHISILTEKTQEQIPDPHILEILRIIDLHNNALHTMRQTFEKIFNNLDADAIAVKQMEFTYSSITFSAGPASIEDYLARHLFRNKEFTIFSSATLSVNKSFEFFSQGIGLNYVDEDQIKNIILDSPFDYKNQMEVFVINEQFLSPGKQEQEKLELVKQAVLTVGGGALLLFTSYKAMDIAYQALSEDFIQSGLHPLKQGEFSREYLINTMRAKDYSVLFGTASFWEGVDVQGDHLRFVVIDKLPFDNPFNPLTKAICRIIEEQGKNPFNEYSIPRAVLKYKQGIGRLIRSKKDRGVLLVLDSRIFSKTYGKNFINAAKPASSSFLSPTEILKKIKIFFNINR
ncbi:MAG: helicase C-terminal domain-containing protein [Brevinema sp.]